MTSRRFRAIACCTAGFLAAGLGSSAAMAQKCTGQPMTQNTSCSVHVTLFPNGCPPPQGCDPTNPTTVRFCTVMTACNCGTMPEMTVFTDGSGNQFCVPKTPGCHQGALANPEGVNDPTCKRWPIRNSIDPNDKVGTLGVSDVGFVSRGVPLSYAVHFENLATATAPAQVVVVTDQLDVQKLDLDTFQLGPISFGNVTLIPEPNAQRFVGGVDLRLDQDLQVAINATLDKSTGLATWRFASIDPATGEQTDDPDAGFLPPNVNPIQGEGSILFTVMPKSGLVTNTQIRNQAVVVFDTNAPIATPTWLNTIDKDPPSTHVLTLAATQTTPAFPVQWTGTDVGAGIRDFSVYVSDNGGAFTLWQDHTAAVSANFTGAVGHTYGFFALGTDLVGNAEPPKTVAEATTQVVNAPVCASNVSAQVQVTRSGFGYNFATQRFVQTVTLKNISAVTIASPIALVLDSLSSNATLFNAGGATTCALPAGSPFINTSGNLNPGASASVTLQFINPTRAGISYATRVLAGSAGR